jgi:hypothetical protein
MIVPYAVPVFAGGYGYGYGYGYPPEPVQQPNITVVMPQQPTPTVVINNHYPAADGPRTSVSVEESAGTPTGGVKVYEANPRRAEPALAKTEPPAAASAAYVRDDKPNIYLIALKDQTVRQAIGYWVKADVLHYVTPGAKIQEVSLEQVDRESSARLNAERKLDFDLGVQ